MAIEAVAESAYLILPAANRPCAWAQLSEGKKEAWREIARSFYAIFLNVERSPDDLADEVRHLRMRLARREAELKIATGAPT